jgi:hypothetical protein
MSLGKQYRSCIIYKFNGDNKNKVGDEGRGGVYYYYYYYLPVYLTAQRPIMT